MSRGSYAPKGSKKKGGNPQQMVKQLQQVQRQMAEAQAALAEEEIEYSAGGGMVKVVVDGQQSIKSIEIDPQVIDPVEKEMLEDLVLAAITGAMEQSQELAQERMGGLAGGLGIPPGLI